MKSKWYVHNRQGEIKGPFINKYTAMWYMNYSCTAVMTRHGSGHYENQYGEIVATEKNMKALRLLTAHTGT